MKIDLTTKILLGLIALGLFAVAFKQPPTPALAGVTSPSSNAVAVAPATERTPLDRIYVVHNNKLRSYSATPGPGVSEELPE